MGLDAYAIDGSSGTSSTWPTRRPDPGSGSIGRPRPGGQVARFTADCVSGPFRLDVLPGVGPSVTDQDPEAFTRGLLSHLARHR